jgi:hypothetical protein
MRCLYSFDYVIIQLINVRLFSCHNTSTLTSLQRFLRQWYVIVVYIFSVNILHLDFFMDIKHHSHLVPSHVSYSDSHQLLESYPTKADSTQ